MFGMRSVCQRDTVSLFPTRGLQNDVFPNPTRSWLHLRGCAPYAKPSGSTVGLSAARPASASMAAAPASGSCAPANVPFADVSLLIERFVSGCTDAAL